MRPPNNTAAIVWRPVLIVALLNNPGLQGTPAASRRPPRQSPTTVTSPDGQYPAPAAATVLIGRMTVLQCCALMPAYLRFLHTVKHFRIVSYHIVSYCDILCDIVSYRIVSCPLWLYRAITNYISVSELYYQCNKPERSTV